MPQEQTAPIAKKLCRTGDVLEGGWIVAGISPFTGLPFSIAPQTLEPISPQDWEGARNYIYDLQQKGHANIRIPSIEEAEYLQYHFVNEGYDNDAKLRWNDKLPHWTSSLLEGTNIEVQYFRDGLRGWFNQYSRALIRPIRDEPDMEIKIDLSPVTPSPL